jgi:hypothetical protein
MKLVGCTLLTLPLLLSAACSDDGGGDGGGGSTGNAGSNTGASGGAGGSGASTGNFAEPEIVSVMIDPPTAVIVVTNGVVPPPTQFKLIGTTTTGTEVELEPAWFFDRPDLATPSPSGDMTATGLLGGTGTLQAQLGDLAAIADVTVKLVFVDDSQAIDPSIKDAFDGAMTPDPAFFSLLYPYDQTVFPRGLVGPELQWNGGGAADVYRIHLESPTFEFTTWSLVPPPSRFNFPTAPADIWRLMTNSTVGDVTLSVQRYDGTQAYQPVVEDWKIAPANLAGTIYYWEINQGQVVRLKPGQSAPQAFLQSPPGVTCIACHSVSANGSTMVASFNGGPSPWGTFDVATGTNNYASGSPSGFQAISPTGSHVVYGQSQGGALSLATSTDVTPLTTLTPTVGIAVHPTWSNDGARIAYGARTDGNWLDFNQSGLFAADVDVNAPAFSNQTELVASNADPAFPVNTYPSYSPDSQWLAFQRSNQARTRGALGQVWLTNTDGSILFPLEELNGVGTLSEVQSRATYQPTFLPVPVGGYFWVVAESERTYGNRLVDENPATRVKQLWVAAIDADPQDGTDPSHPAFWLPGQELNNQNMRGAWALDPCKAEGESCEAGFECCEGSCVKDAETNTFICGPQEGCVPNGSACESAADCCEAGAQCLGGFCSGVAPQ